MNLTISPSYTDRKTVWEGVKEKSLDQKRDPEELSKSAAQEYSVCYAGIGS